MRVAISADGPDLNDNVSHRLGLSPYLLLVDLESGAFETVQNSDTSSRKGAGMRVVAMIIANKSNALLTGWCSPVAKKYLSAHGVDVVTGLSGTVAEVLERFEIERVKLQAEKPKGFRPSIWKIDREIATQAVRSAVNQFRNLLPVMIGVVFLVGLFNAFISKDLLASLFSGSPWMDSFRGTAIGSAFTGNPINSYIIGSQLLERGVSLFAVTAFICSWVTVGLLQLPAEITALGWKFALARNVSCFVLSMAVSFLMMFLLNLFGI